MKKTSPGVEKMSDRSSKMVLLGYRFVDPTTERLHVSCDVVFQEERGGIQDDENNTQQFVDTSDPCEIWFQNAILGQII